MIFLHHLATFVAAVAGLSLGLYLGGKFKNSTLFTCFVIFAFFFGLGVFLHVFVFDVPIYQTIYEDGRTVYEKYIIHGEPWPICSTEGLINRILKDDWGCQYPPEYRNISGN